MRKERKFKLWSELHPEVKPQIKKELFWFNLRNHPILLLKNLLVNKKNG